MLHTVPHCASTVRHSQTSAAVLPTSEQVQRPQRRHQRERAGAAASPPHLVYILTDDHGWANFGFHNAQALTPNIDQLATVEGIVDDVRPQSENLMRLQQQRLNLRLHELEVKTDPARLEQEVALLAQRSDIREELDRLMIHVAEAYKLMDAPGPHGRRLDFLAQELNREANTLGAKATQTDVSQKAIDLKVVIEQIREQVQNVE